VLPAEIGCGKRYHAPREARAALRDRLASFAGAGPGELAPRRPPRLATVAAVTIIKINAITVPADAGDELGRRFAARAGAVDQQDGFEGFELLRPTDDRRTWLVVTRWRDEAAFDAWVASPAFGHGHQGPRAAAPDSAAEPPAGGEDPAPPKPLAMTSELWSYETAHHAPPR
jgi:heme-degrading monooxygenase HmoA